MLTDLQKQKLTSLFHVVDGDSNGIVEWADYERLARTVAETRPYEEGSPGYEALMECFRYAWEHAEPHLVDGGLDLERWMAYTDRVLGTPGVFDKVIRKTATTVFDTFDLDDDGRVSMPEWKTFYRCYGIDDGYAQECFERFDLDDDGHVSRAELIDLVAQFYISSDPNAPGNWLYGPF